MITPEQVDVVINRNRDVNYDNVKFDNALAEVLKQSKEFPSFVHWVIRLLFLNPPAMIVLLILTGYEMGLEAKGDTTHAHVAGYSGTEAANARAN
jgi:hypothetical protein